VTYVDKRAHYRLPIRVPIFLKGVDVKGDEFFELTHTVDVSASGACFLTRRELAIDNDLLVSIPAPVDTNTASLEDYEFKFPAKIVRLDNGSTAPHKKISVRFKKLLYDKP
jgi:hypothetical protein